MAHRKAAQDESLEAKTALWGKWGRVSIKDGFEWALMQWALNPVRLISADKGYAPTN